MIVYQNDNRISLKWVVAIIIFVLAMTITFDEVEGIEIGSGSAGEVQLQESVANLDRLTNTDTNNPDMIDTKPTYTNYEHAPVAPTNSTTSVPEPGTLILIGTGLSALYALGKSKISS